MVEWGDKSSQYLLWINAKSGRRILALIHVADCQVIAALLDGNHSVLLQMSQSLAGQLKAVARGDKRKWLSLQV